MAERERKGKRPPKKRRKMKKSAYYEAKGDSIARKRVACPKCGAGIFMAEHKNRQACGKCGFTQWKKEGL
ncbi:30S ribosomal protein S27ae [archaeon]|nr:30S ribosomal protein S27ae [archaeon]